MDTFENGTRRWVKRHAATAIVMLVCVVVLCVPVVRDYRVLKRIQRLGGRVFRIYDYLPEQVRDRLEGSKAVLFSRVIGIQCNHSELDDGLACQLSTFKDIDVLSLDNSCITRQGLACLVSLPKLRALHLSNSK